MTVEEESVLEEAFDAVMEFVGDEDVQRGTGYLLVGGLAIAALIGVGFLIMMYWQWIVGAIVLIVLIMIFGQEEATAYCADCGNVLGRGTPGRPCSRRTCGSNRWTTNDPGAGMTVKNR